MLTSSFFRTHPPSVDRAILSLAELEYLPKRAKPITDSMRFRNMRAVADSWLKTHKRLEAGTPPECGAVN
jgi:hypothetical protein